MIAEKGDWREEGGNASMARRTAADGDEHQEGSHLVSLDVSQAMET